jgi:hypothetical protein
MRKTVGDSMWNANFEVAAGKVHEGVTFLTMEKKRGLFTWHIGVEHV